MNLISAETESWNYWKIKMERLQEASQGIQEHPGVPQVQRSCKEQEITEPEQQNLERRAELFQSPPDYSWRIFWVFLNWEVLLCEKCFREEEKNDYQLQRVKNKKQTGAQEMHFVLAFLRCICSGDAHQAVQGRLQWKSKNSLFFFGFFLSRFPVCFLLFKALMGQQVEWNKSSSNRPQVEGRCCRSGLSDALLLRGAGCVFCALLQIWQVTPEQNIHTWWQGDKRREKKRYFWIVTLFLSCTTVYLERK